MAAVKLRICLWHKIEPKKKVFYGNLEIDSNLIFISFYVKGGESYFLFYQGSPLFSLGHNTAADHKTWFFTEGVVGANKEVINLLE